MVRPMMRDRGCMDVGQAFQPDILRWSPHRGGSRCHLCRRRLRPPIRDGAAPGSVRSGDRAPSKKSDTRSPATRIAALAIIAMAWALICGMAAGVRAEDVAPGDHNKSLSFSRDIRPILADKCFKCHGPDAGERKGKLRLDNAKDATSPAASGSAAIVPRKLEDSELYQRIISTDG